MPGCDFDDLFHRVQQHPCGSSDWNWEKQVEFNNFLIEVISRIPGCITAGNDSRLRRFELTANLSLGGSAAAKLLITPAAWVDDPDNLAVTVHDRTESPGRWQGVTTVRGWCTPEGGTNYSIVDMDEVAQLVVYQLDEHLTGSSASATVVSANNGLDPGSTITVHDPFGIWRQWHRYNCFGMAAWCRELAQYVIVGGPQMVERRRQATLVNGTCPDAILPPYADLEDNLSQGIYSGVMYDIDTDPLSPTFGQWIEVTRVPLENYVVNRGRDGDKIIIEGWYFHDNADVDPLPDALKWDYEITEPQGVVVAQAVRYENPCALVVDLTTIYTQWCENQTTEPIDIPFTQEELVELIYEFSNIPAADPEIWVCQIRYTTGLYCAIRLDDGGDYLGAEFTRREYVKSMDLVNAAIDPIFDPPDYRWRYVSEYVWIACWADGQTYEPFDVIDVEIIDLFVIDDQADEMDPSCIVYATTKRYVVFDPELGAAGTDKVVLVTTPQRVVTDVVDDGTVITIHISTVYVVCKNEETSETIAVETCS